MGYKKAIYRGAVCLMLIAFFALLIRPAAQIKLMTSATPAKAEPRVIVDAGHGGEDGGAVSADGVPEKGINLSISNDLSDLLTVFGFSVEKTRTDDNALSDDGDSVKARKVNDMKLRLEKFNSSPENVIISIHQNKFSSTKSKGTQVFYSPNNENSQKLADTIKDSVRSLLQPENERLSKKADGNIFLLKNTDNPAVIVECGFLSNPEESALLVDEGYQKEMAFSISTGFLDYYHL